MALYRQAITALSNSDTGAAESIFTQLTNNRPEIAGPWANLALIQYNDNNIDKASEYLQKALELSPKMAQALNLKAQLEVRNGNIKEAEQLYIQAIDSDDNYANAHYNIALLYDIYLQDIQKAIKHYKRYLELTDNKDTATIEWLQHLEATVNNS